MKQVLVIEDVDKFKELWQFGKYDWERVLKENSPGNLLAEVKGTVLETEIEDYRAGRVKILTIHSSDLILENPEKRKATVLILDREKK